MKIIVLVKEVPDTYGSRKIDIETGLADRAASESVLDEISERALEVAFAHADGNPGTEIVAVSVSPASATATVRKALAVGADSAVHVVDEQLRGADVLLTAEVLAAAIRRAGFDLVVAGNASTDGSSGMLPPALAEALGVAHLTGLSAIELSDSEVRGTRSLNGGIQVVRASLPAVISITEALPDMRFPNFKGIMAAKKKPIETISLAELGVDADDPTIARSIMLTVAERPPRAAGVKITDEGDAGARIADFLVKNRLV